MSLTVAVICNDPKLDKDFIDSLKFGDEVLIVSNNNIPKDLKNTQKISYYSHPLNNDFSQQRNYAISKAKGDWILFVDTDEIIGQNLSKEIIAASNSKDFNGYYVKRIDLCFHQPFLYGETGNIKILRLARKKSGKFVRSVHEYWQINGRVGELVHPLYHQKDHFIPEFLGRISFYGENDSAELTKENKPFSYLRLLFYPKAKFIMNYFIKRGFMDGLPGLFLAYLMMVQSLSVRVFQWISQKYSTV